MIGLAQSAGSALRTFTRLHAGHPQLVAEWGGRRWRTADNRSIPVVGLSVAHLRNILCLILRRAYEGYKWAESEHVPGKLVYSPHDRRGEQAGRWLCMKADQQARQHGVYRAARNLRKQGVPLDLALAILVGGKRVCGI